ncbi:unnamed protein product [Camellia sinensis]
MSSGVYSKFGALFSKALHRRFMASSLNNQPSLKKEGNENGEDRISSVLGIANDKNWPVFPNLTHLGFDDVGCKSLPNLLNGVPNLCTMVFTKVPLLDSFEPSEQFYWFEPQGVPSCFRCTLKEITVSGIDGLQDERHLVKYFLENAIVLEKMTIGYRMLSMKEEDEFLRLLVRQLVLDLRFWFAGLMDFFPFTE